MHPNLDGSTWLGQGGALKVFWKGFGSAVMLGGFFFFDYFVDLSDFFGQNG